MRALSSGGVRLVYDVIREKGTDYGGAVSSSCVASIYRALQERHVIPQEREAFVVFGLNSRHRVVLVHVVSVGSLQSSIVHPREVFRPALVAGCAAVVVAHHHPSGDPAPSPEDRTITARLREAGDLLGVGILDHVVVGDGRHYSFADEMTHDA